MNSNILRLAAFAAAMALASASSFASAAEGASCVVRSAAAQGASEVGRLNTDGKCVAAKPEAKAKAGTGMEASAQCRDLSFSYNPRREAACAKHGGIMQWLAQQ